MTHSFCCKAISSIFFINSIFMSRCTACMRHDSIIHDMPYLYTK
jgi:hypothetical protein